mmetsp:Transcript_28450/g.48095  ORF Transcript_28450/g.48095 Transcript_28450/m.48095 type:complete len:328 (-) Transcript_28450:1388-2371(-)
MVNIESAPLVPPFMYHNQCGSAVLSAYIPVFLLGYSIQMILSLVILTSLMAVPYKSVPSSVYMIVHGLLWPEHWLQSGDALILNKSIVACRSDALLRTGTIYCNDVLNNWLVMMTFGLCSPVLAVAVVCTVLLKMSLFVMLIGRYTSRILVESGECGRRGSTGAEGSLPPFSGSTATENVSNTYQSSIRASEKDAESRSNLGYVDRSDVVLFALTALARAYISLFKVLAGSFWRLSWCSALFVALLGWDLAADDVGWLASMWTLLPLVWVVVMRVMSLHWFKIDGGDFPEQSESIDVHKSPGNSDEDGGVDETGEISRSPLHLGSEI